MVTKIQPAGPQHNTTPAQPCIHMQAWRETASDLFPPASLSDKAPAVVALLKEPNVKVLTDLCLFCWVLGNVNQSG